MKQTGHKLQGRFVFIFMSIVIFTTAFFLYVFFTFKINTVEPSSLINNPYLLLGVMLVVLILYFMAIILLINKYIFTPIYEMKKAAENIRSGNLNYPIRYNASNEIGEFCIEFDKMRIRLKDMMSEQQELEKRRKRLIASIAHDLRTPLTSIKGYVEAIEDGIVKDEETLQRYLSTINQKTDFINHLIDDLSIYTKQELGEFTLNTSRMNAIDILNNYFNHKLEEFRYSHINLVLKKPFISCYINVDPYRFHQILDNLIGNAQKYAASEIVVSTHIIQYHLRVLICDDGGGIPQDLLQNIFDPFFMVNKIKDQSEKGGSGLGLAIVKQLIEGHNGTISVESIIGKGTCFTLDIPIAR